MIAAGLRCLLPRVVLDRFPIVVSRTGTVRRWQEHFRVLILMIVGVVVRQPLVKIADHRIRTDLRPVVVLMVGGHRVDGGPQTGADNRRSLVGSLRVFLHVLRQIGLLGVTLAAVLAYVGLEMLRLLVLGYVLEEAGLVGETLVTGIALVRLVGLMTTGVTLEIAQLAERLRAARMTTFVRLVACVSANVLLEMT